MQQGAESVAVLAGFRYDLFDHAAIGVIEFVTGAVDDELVGEVAGDLVRVAQRSILVILCKKCKF